MEGRRRQNWRRGDGEREREILVMRYDDDDDNDDEFITGVKTINRPPAEREEKKREGGGSKQHARLHGGELGEREGGKKMEEAGKISFHCGLRPHMCIVQGGWGRGRSITLKHLLAT